jgi:hypothetical protein
MAQACFGCSGGFGPISLPLFQGLRRGATALVSLTVSMVLLPFSRRRPSMLRRPNCRGRMSDVRPKRPQFNRWRARLTAPPDPERPFCRAAHRVGRRTTMRGLSAKTMQPPSRDPGPDPKYGVPTLENARSSSRRVAARVSVDSSTPRRTFS